MSRARRLRLGLQRGAQCPLKAKDRKPSNDIDTVLDLFSRDRGAYVGYSSCEAPFYLLLTDCVRTLRRLVSTDPRLSELRALLARANKPARPRASFHARNGGDHAPAGRYRRPLGHLSVQRKL